jgi:hypothetical protein
MKGEVGCSSNSDLAQFLASRTIRRRVNRNVRVKIEIILSNDDGIASLQCFHANLTNPAKIQCQFAQPALHS